MNIKNMNIEELATAARNYAKELGQEDEVVFYPEGKNWVAACNIEFTADSLAEAAYKLVDRLQETFVNKKANEEAEAEHLQEIAKALEGGAKAWKR